MIRTNPKRSATHWRVFLLFLGFLGSVVLVSSAPTDPGDPGNSKERTSSLSSPRRSSEQDIGSPSELAWQAWLLVDAQPSGSNIGLDSASILRRITPKSVFIAPSLQACADGYKADNMGRCQKIVNIDHEAHLNFLVQRLNQLYGKGPSQAANTSTDKKQSPTVTGPLQLNIPLLPAASNDESSFSIEKEEPPQVAIPLEIRKEVSVVNYKRNDTRMNSGEKYEESFSFDSNSTDREKNNQGPSSPAFFVPVVDFIDEANDTFLDIVDYKIPLGLQAVPSHSIDHNLRKQGFSPTEETLTHEDNTTTITTTTTMTTTTAMFSSRDQISEDNSFRETVIATLDSRMENLTESPVQEEMIIDGVSDIASKMETWRNESDMSSVQGIKKNETSKADVLYEEESEPDLVDQEEYSDTTQVSEEDSEESEDELLKHGETGMAIPFENQVLIRSEKTKKKTQIPKDDFSVETTTFFENKSDFITLTTETGEDLGSNVSSEVSINKDFVLETTLLDVNTGKVKNSTKPVLANNTASHQNREDDLKAFFEVEKQFIPEPEVIFSPQDNRGSLLYGRKRDGQLLKTNFQFINESHNSTITEKPMTSKAILHPALLKVETRPIEKQASFQSEKTLPQDSKNNFPFQSPNFDSKPSDLTNFRPIPVNRDEQDFVRFPNYERRRQGYVRFPSDDVNNIHIPEMKQSFPHLREEYPSSLTSTKSSVSFNQKQSNWWISSPPQMDRQQTLIQEQTPQNQSPMLLRFWARMPLLRDPSLDVSFPAPNDQTFQRDTISMTSRVFSPSRRNNFYKENSPPHEVKKVFSQSVQSSIRG